MTRENNARRELNEQRLEHRESAEAFYRERASRGEKVRVGMEASGHSRWFERLLAELGIELWLGDAAVIRAKRGRRKPKTDRQDAQHILHLLLKDDFPSFCIDKGNLLEARMVIAPYNNHVGSFLRAVWLAYHHQLYSGRGADIVMESITPTTRFVTVDA
jgi:hypothetical protein